MKKITSIILSTTAFSLVHTNANSGTYLNQDPYPKPEKSVVYYKPKGPVICPTPDIKTPGVIYPLAFHGGFFGIQLGGAHHKPDVDQTLHNTKTSSGDVATGVLTGVLIGANVRSNDFVFGVEGHLHKDFTSTNHTFSTNKLSIDHVYALGLGLKMGVVIPESTLLFIKAGIEFNRFSIEETTSKNSFHHNSVPFLIGAGIEKQYGNMGIRLSYDYTYKSDSKTHTINQLNTQFDFKRPKHKLLVGIVWHF